MIQELFDSTKDIRRRIESVVNFSDNSKEDLTREINEYVVTDNLRTNYNKVICELKDAFTDGSNEVGVWVSGFYGSGKSSFAKYLGYAFDKAMIVDGISFGEKLMNRIDDPEIKALYNGINKMNPIVILIDLSMDAAAGKTANVSDIMYKEALKLLGITTTEPKLADFETMLYIEKKYDDFVALIQEKEGKDWNTISIGSIRNLYAMRYAHIILPQYFRNEEDYRNLTVETNESEKERLQRLISLIKERTGKDKVIFVIDEVGQYVAGSDELIRSMQGTMQNIKTLFHGNVWLIATAQQTLTEDNPAAQLNSDKLYRLNDRFPIKVDIEADDIKEIITKRLLGKSPEGKKLITSLFQTNESTIKYGTKFTNMERSRYIKALDSESFANLYPFLPVHIDILLALLHKLASRTGGAGLRSVIRLIRDILIDSKLAEKVEGYMATPDLFYDALKSNMEKNADFREIVYAAQNAINANPSNSLWVRICKTIALMQLLDDFNLSFDNLCALLYEKIGLAVDKVEVRKIIDDIKETPGITLQEIDGRLRFMTNAIISIQEERMRINTPESEKMSIMVELVKDLLSPQPTVNIFGTKSIKSTVELVRGNKVAPIFPGDDIRLNIRFVEASDYTSVRTRLLTDSTRAENKQTIYWVCTLPQEIETLLIDVIRDKTIYNNHRSESNKEIKDYLKACQSNETAKRTRIKQLLIEAQNNSETICQGSPTQVNGETYRTDSLKKFAEKVYAKYALANKSMSASVVTDLYDHGDNKLPESLNPFGIVKDDGMIDSGNKAFIELKYYIASKPEDVSGSDLLDRFSKAEYGWSKDTTRYLIALMLKASLIEIRSGAQSFHMFTKNAAEAMKNNQFFNKVGISISTKAELNQVELMKARKLLVELYNSTSTLPVPASIAKNAYKIFPQKKSDADTLLRIFSIHSIAGKDMIQRAINYMDRIIKTEGQDAPALLAKDQDCETVLRYTVNVLKQQSLLENIKKIAKRIDDSGKLSSTYFSELSTSMGEVEQTFNTLKENPDFYTNAANFADLFSQVEKIIEKGCMDFYKKASQDIEDENHKISEEVAATTISDEAKKKIETSISGISVSLSDNLEQLQESYNSFSSLFVPGGKYSSIRAAIKAATQQPSAQPTPYPPTQNTGNGTPQVHSPRPSKVHRPKAKSRMTSATEVNTLISELQNLLKDFQEGDTVELNFE